MWHPRTGLTVKRSPNALVCCQLIWIPRSFQPPKENITIERIPNVMNHDSTRLQHVLEHATTLEEKLECIIGKNPLGSHVTHQQVLKIDGKSVRNVNVKEVEKALGFSAGYTDVRPIDNEERKPEPKQEM
ncbi:hypothetical protein KP509_22G011000 [Ceratopteris richardii]|uniref:Uncharacterized protein n=1 Tax=Ceratopteris richardii TaxID=49495 RepID=A0A8T2S2N3_CERRI|nr:hypothetical protein KP509_22G011000 [Ceratopteris richardii]